MTGWNLPPGVTESMLPGNRPEDAEWDTFAEWSFDQYIDSGLDVDDCKKAVLLGIKAVKARK